MADTFARYHCNYCEENIIGLRIKCVECEDFDLCLQCFASGAEIGKHKAGHDYQFMDTGQYSLFGNYCSTGNGNGGTTAAPSASSSSGCAATSKTIWTAREEVRLLDAIEQYGYGNWEDISRHIESKTADEARLKYIGCYIEGSIGRATWGSAMERRQLPIEHNHGGESADSLVAEGPLSPSLPSTLVSSGLALFDEPTPEECGALGSLQLRDDFEREWDNEAECAVAPLFLHSTDDEDVDIALKLAQVDMYMRSLRERSRRKRVVRDFQLIQQFFKKEHDKQHQQPRKKHKDDREIISEKLRGVSQFQTASEHYNLVNSLLKEKQFKQRIKELNRYRRNGVRHVEECFEFDTARARRDKRKDSKKKGAAPSSSSQPLTQTPHETMTAQQLLRPNENDEKNLKYSVVKKSTAPDTGDGRWPNGSCSDTGNSSSSNSNSQSSDATEAAAAAPALPDPDVSSLPGYHLLSVQERKLCSSLKLKPAQYISYKAVVLKESFETRHSVRNRSGSNSGLARSVWCPPGLDSSAQHTLHTFLSSAGWITSEG